ncbi:uncharacterized protein MYCFIDRAFT_170727 [Pseudocercospora fijiensis CIRAD86]|uniref:Uncharacterized protein n=1 Tax=Pseudocercospora fijiensis (strain CIRAD86) TaxID=383855 RepID=N1QCF3_PSEFD|nr:uncharacterized protein MYCFIDRAFT_170727 [Pseudocercospora fijiensis CIRAD86]EME89232.1 hypothetical protein MYCFIDRAFT_170727 [Pseudocercospora fijiensis CIRAD86]
MPYWRTIQSDSKADRSCERDCRLRGPADEVQFNARPRQPRNQQLQRNRRDTDPDQRADGQQDSGLIQLHVFDRFHEKELGSGVYLWRLQERRSSRLKTDCCRGAPSTRMGSSTPLQNDLSNEHALSTPLSSVSQAVWQDPGTLMTPVSTAFWKSPGSRAERAHFWGESWLAQETLDLPAVALSDAKEPRIIKQDRMCPFTESQCGATIAEPLRSPSHSGALTTSISGRSSSQFHTASDHIGVKRSDPSHVHSDVVRRCMLEMQLLESSQQSGQRRLPLFYPCILIYATHTTRETAIALRHWTSSLGVCLTKRGPSILSSAIQYPLHELITVAIIRPGQCRPWRRPATWVCTSVLVARYKHETPTTITLTSREIDEDALERSAAIAWLGTCIVERSFRLHRNTPSNRSATAHLMPVISYRPNVRTASSCEANVRLSRCKAERFLDDDKHKAPNSVPKPKTNERQMKDI